MRQDGIHPQQCLVRGLPESIGITKILGRRIGEIKSIHILCSLAGGGGSINEFDIIAPEFTEVKPIRLIRGCRRRSRQVSIISGSSFGIAIGRTKLLVFEVYVMGSQVVQLLIA